MWYKLASTNGLGADSQLTAGQVLNIPSGVQRACRNAGTFKPFDPSEVIGDTSPTTPQPQANAGRKKNKCGVFGQILLVAVAVAVSVWASPASGITFLQGALAGAAGSLASQVVGVATGIQDKFSFKGLALSALSGGVAAGVGNVAGLSGGSGLTGVLQGAARGALGNAITQGIGVATGLQSKFDFVGVAVGGISAGAGQLLQNAGLDIAAQSAAASTTRTVADYANAALSGAAGAIAGAATRSVLTGTDFGDNVLATLPDVIGNTIGSIVGDRLAAPERLTARARAATQTLDPSLLNDRERFADFRRAFKDTEGRIRTIDFSGNAYDRTNALADAYKPLLMGFAADKTAASEALSALRGDVLTEVRGERFAANQDIGTVIFNGLRAPSGPALGIAILDTLAIQSGSVAMRLGKAYDSLPTWASYAITAVGFAVDAAAGPIVFALRRGPSYLTGRLTAAAADITTRRFASLGYSAAQSALGGAGILIVAGLVFTGASYARSLLASGRIGGMISRLRGVARETQTMSPFTRRYLTESGGRFGNTATRTQNYSLARGLQGERLEITGGGGFRSEEYIRGNGPGNRGGTFVDITARTGDGRTVRIQTVDTLADGVTPTPREAAAAARIRAAFPNDELRLIPKGR